MKQSRKCAVIFLLCGALLGLGGCAGKQPSPGGKKNSAADGSYTVVTIGSADSGGSMYAASAAMAVAMTGQDETYRFNINASTGSLDNIVQILDGGVDMAFVSEDALIRVKKDSRSYGVQKSEKLRAIGAVYESVSCWMTLRDEKVRYVHDLKGKKISVGPERSSTYLASLRALEAAGISNENDDFVNCGLGTGAERVALGEVHAVHGLAGLPIPGLSALAAKADCALLTFTDEELAEICIPESGFYRTEIPADTYRGQSKAVPTFGTRCILCVSEDMDPELVYHLTGLLMDGVSQLEQQWMFAKLTDDEFRTGDLAVPLHAGAEKWYAEHKED